MGDDYSFLQEKIKDEAGSPKTLRKKIVRMILFGFIFGVVACITFFAFKPWMEDFIGENIQEVSIPEDEMELSDEDVPEREEVQIESEEQVQKKMLKALQNTAKDLKSSIVFVSGQEKMEENSEVKGTSGVIIADNGSELLILSQMLGDSTFKNTKATFADGSECPAKWKRYDDNMEVGIWAVNKENITEETLGQVQAVTLGNSFQTQTGEPGIVMGISSGDDLKISFGFIASGDDKVDISDGSIDLLRVDVAGAMFADGMVFNQTGEMVGLISTLAGDNQPHVMAYSISHMKKEIELMSNGKEVPYVGIRGIELPEELKVEGLEVGICVQEIDTDSPAMKAGIQCGDVITHIGDTEISSMKEYRTALLREDVKNGITLTGLRKGADNSYVEMTFHVNSAVK